MIQCNAPLGEGDAVVDVVSGAVAINNGATPAVIDGMACMVFDDNMAHIETAFNPQTGALVDEFTWEFWNYYHSVDAQLAVHGASASNPRFYIDTANQGSGTVRLGVGDVFFDVPDFTVEVGRWYHIAITYQEGTLRIYFDGELVYTHSDVTNTVQDDSVYEMGLYRRGDLGTIYGSFNGASCEHRFWRKARTQHQIKTMMNRRLHGTEQGLVAYWPLAREAQQCVDRREQWLSDLSVQRVLLAELHHAGGIEYVSTAPYISKPTDSDPNRPYDDLLEAAVDVATRIDGLIQFGEISLVDDGSISHWIPRAWQGHPIRLYLGGPEWSRDDFLLLAIGRNGGIHEARFGEIVFEMDDESSVLDEPIDTGELPDDMGPVPLALGSVYNAPAYRVESQTLTYRVSYLPISSASAKDNGAAISHSTDTSAGTVVLDQPLVGELSVDIEEEHSTPSQIVGWVAGQYGIATYEAELPDHIVGLYYNSEVSGREILDDLCEGLGAYWYISSVGQLVVRQHTVPTAADFLLGPDEIVQHQVRLVETQGPWKGLTLRWRRNYQPLTTIAGSVEDSTSGEAARLRASWRERRGAQDVDDYPLAEHVERDSVLQSSAGAAAEHDRLLALRSVRREVWAIEAFTPPVEVGMAIEVEHPLLSGRIGRIISVSRSPTRDTTELEVWL